MSEPYLGEVRLFSFAFPPNGWAQCSGQTLAISQNQALFSLLGVQYGGDGRTTFALPNLQGRTPLGQGSGSGATYTVGQTGGSETVSLNVTNLAPHTHLMNAVGGSQGNQASPSAALPATAKPGKSGIAVGIYAPAGGSMVPLTSASVSATGGSSAHNNLQPFLTLNYCIALQGIFPSRN